MTYKWIAPLLLLVSQQLIAQPLFWSAKKDGQELLIFGSMHLGTEDMYPLPQPITQFLQNSDGLILEANLESGDPITPPQNNRTAKEVLSDEQLGTLKEISDDLGIEPYAIANSPAWAAAMTLQKTLNETAGQSAVYSVDSNMQALAIKYDVPVLAFESVQFQIDLLSKFGEELLIDTISDYDKTIPYIECLSESWKVGDKHKLEQVAEEFSYYPEVQQAFMTDRNKDWAKKLASGKFIPEDSGKYIVVVGTLHLVGEDNLIALLENAGYSTTQLSTSKQATCSFSEES